MAEKEHREVMFERRCWNCDKGFNGTSGSPCPHCGEKISTVYYVPDEPTPICGEERTVKAHYEDGSIDAVCCTCHQVVHWPHGSSVFGTCPNCGAKGIRGGL